MVSNWLVAAVIVADTVKMICYTMLYKYCITP